MKHLKPGFGPLLAPMLTPMLALCLFGVSVISAAQTETSSDTTSVTAPETPNVIRDISAQEVSAKEVSAREGRERPTREGVAKERVAKDISSKDGSNRETVAKETGPKEGGNRSEKMKQRLEQLFIWRVADRLQLPPAEESKFTEEFHRLSEERSKLSTELDSTLDQIEREKENSEKSSKLLTDYTSVLKRYNAIQNKEMDIMSHLFGTKKMVQYVLLKREMTRKFKDVLSTSTTAANSNEKTVLKEPEVIEQK